MLLVAACVAVISAFHYDLQFFNDSKAYATQGFEASNSSVHRWILIQAPGYQQLSFFLAAGFLWSLLKTCRNTLVLIVFFHPYSLLLIFNGTKEQLVFLGIMSLYFCQRSRLPIELKSLIFACGIVFSTIRGFYLPLALLPFLPFLLRTLRWKPSTALAILVFTLSIFAASQWENISYYYDWLRSRSSYTHIGRDYFSGLCYSAKENIIDFFFCWLGTYIGLPFHKDVFSLNFLIHLSILVITYVAWATALAKRSYVAVLYFFYTLVLCFIFFWWGPVLGAAQRYLWPALWAVILILEVPTRLVFKNEVARSSSTARQISP